MISREIRDLREVVTKLVPMLAGKNLRVTQIGSQAFVQPDPKTGKPARVNIPSIPDDASPEFVLAVQGFIDHEVAHVLITDWDWVGDTRKKRIAAKKLNPAQIHQLHNIVEDTMIERVIVTDFFPGSRKTIHNMRVLFIDKVTSPALNKARGNVAEEFNVLLVPAMRALAGHEEFQEFMDKGGHWRQPMIAELIKKLDPKTLAKLPKLRTTEETYYVAEEIQAIIYPPAPPPPPQKPEQQPEEGEGEGEPDDGADGQSQDKPDKKAGEGDGDGERDHSESEPGEDGDEDDKKPGKGKKDEKDDADGSEDANEADGAAGDGEDADEDGEPEGSGADADDGDEESEGEDDQPGDDADGVDPDDEETADGTAGEDSADDDAEPEDDGAGGSDADGDSDDGDDRGEDDAGGADGQEGEEGQNGEDADGDGADSNAGAADGDDGAAGEDGGKSGELDASSHNDERGGNPQDVGDGEEAEAGGSVGDGGLAKSLFEADAVAADAFDKADVSSAIAELIATEVLDALTSDEYNVLTREGDRIEPMPVDDTIFQQTWVSDMDDTTRQMVGRMQKDIERMMASQSHVVRVPGYRSGRLHAGSLHRLMNNDDRVFSRRQEHKSKDTAVSLVVDNSGSMNDNSRYINGRWERRGPRKVTIAMIAAYALALTLERVNIANEVIGFTTGDYEHLAKDVVDQIKAELMNAWSKGLIYHRTEPLNMPIYKGFDERVGTEVKRRIAFRANTRHGMSNNVDGESIEYAALRLLKRREKRKVMIVLSDGQPAGARNVEQHLRQTVEHITKMGVDIVGIGIMDSSVKRYYPKSVVLNDLEALPGQVMTELRDILQ